MRGCNETVLACAWRDGGNHVGGLAYVPSDCEACLGVVGDALYEMRTHRLGYLRSDVLKARKDDG